VEGVAQPVGVLNRKGIIEIHFGADAVEGFLTSAALEAGRTDHGINGIAGHQVQHAENEE
jgi:hypothetical protein